MKILFTGGGTAGHVTPNLALIEAAGARGDTCLYVGSTTGIERDLVQGIPYFGIASGKLRRYFSWQNFVDPFRIVFGALQALALCLRERPDIVFSKGGFVAVPVVAAAWLCRIPVVCHESDVTPGLANRLSFPFARIVCVNFEQTRAYVPAGARVTGTPVRASLLAGDAARGRALLGLETGRPVLLVFGGSLGATAINRQVRAVLPMLLERFQVVHVTGAGQEDPALAQAGYIQKPFIRDGFGDVIAAADIVVSRAGANSLYELLVLRKPHLLVPLSAAASRGDQIVNARTFADAGMSRVLQEHELTNDAFLGAVDGILRDSAAIRANLEKFERKDSVAGILQILTDVTGET